MLVVGGVRVCVLGNNFDAARGCATAVSDAGEVGDGITAVWTWHLVVFEYSLTGLRRIVKVS